MLSTSEVLIETYWNVKYLDADELLLLLYVLIETYWNVKKNMKYQPVFSQAGINRNILECKDFHQ